jgi:hypothetical protein
MTIRLPPNAAKSPTAGRKSTTANLEGWIETKPKKRRQSAVASTTNKRQKSTKKAAAKSTKKTKPTSKKKSAPKSKSKTPSEDRRSSVSVTEIIDIDDDSTSDDEPIMPQRPRRQAASKISREVVVEDDLMIDSDPDEEYEFDG